MNFESQPLQLHEIQTMKADPVIIERIIRSYELMLDFYGMQLESAESGLLKRSDNYKGQYTNLMRQYIQNKISLWAETAHNCMYRITTQLPAHFAYHEMLIGIWA